MAAVPGGDHGGALARERGRRARRTSNAVLARAQGAHVDLDCLPRLLGFNLRRAHQSCWRQYATAIGDHDFRPGLFGLLVLVAANPGIAQIELGTSLGIDKATIVALLDRLEKAGLLSRRRSTSDRRRHGIFLTERGAAALACMQAEVRSVERRIASRFTRSEFEQLLGLLRRLQG
jgi:DNA-binding MarR family transcriptional regulator